MTYYSDFYDLFELHKDNPQAINEAVISFIEAHKSLLEKDEERKWLVKICEEGSLSLLHYCEKTFSTFSLYDHSKPVEHYSNLGFLRAILSGHLDLIDYFVKHPELSHFLKRKHIGEDIGRTIEQYKDNHKRRKTFDYDRINHYENLICYFANKITGVCSYIFDFASRNNEQDEITPVLSRFVNQYHDDLEDFFTNDDNDCLTIHFMLNSDHESYHFAQFLKNKFPKHILDKERVEIMLYWGSNHNIKQLQWLLEHPELYQLNSSHFHAIFRQLFESPLKTKIKKEDYEYLNELIKNNLYALSFHDFEKAIIGNMTPLVKKYHKQFKDDAFSQLYYYNNTCTYFLEKYEAAQKYNKLDKQLKQKDSSSKKFKI